MAIDSWDVGEDLALVLVPIMVLLMLLLPPLVVVLATVSLLTWALVPLDKVSRLGAETETANLTEPLS